MDAMSWRRFCTAFGQKSNNLCSALAAAARGICSTYVHPTPLIPYTACRLIPLNKCPGVRPIGIGEVVRKIFRKDIKKITRQDLQNAVGSLKLCAGQVVGCEAAVHAVNNIFSDDNMEAMIFVDASNAFNSLNRQATLLNSKAICPCPDKQIQDRMTRGYSWMANTCCQKKVLRSSGGSSSNGHVCNWNPTPNTSTEWYCQVCGLLINWINSDKRIFSRSHCLQNI